jgi:DNA-binding CsgD family transcriptional regulator
MRNTNTLQADACLEEALAGGIAEFQLPIAGCPPKRKSDASLTGRETQVLRWIVDGKTNKQIAKMLSRSTRTVEYHRNRLMKKLNAHTAAELVKQAIKMGCL